MESTKKKTYIVYGGDDIPYEPAYPIASFLDKNKAKEFLEKLKKENEENVKLSEHYNELDCKYWEYLCDNNLEDEEDDIQEEAISKEFGVTKEFVQKVRDSYECPQIYYISTVDLYK